MNARVEERVENWGTRPFSGGHAGLRDLADEEFTGVVETTDGTWLCLLNGTVVGVFGGRMADLEDAEGTAYLAPDPALPLLFAMWEQGGTQEDSYYTNDTPISEADETLSSGGFAGYIELSENVLSGDYYVCYYGGRSMSVAFVGANERLITGDEAFERADDEIGIYDVYSVDLEVVEVPDPDPEGSPAAAGAAGAAAGATDAEDAGGATDAASAPSGSAGRRNEPRSESPPGERPPERDEGRDRGQARADPPRRDPEDRGAAREPAAESDPDSPGTDDPLAADPGADPGSEDPGAPPEGASDPTGRDAADPAADPRPDSRSDPDSHSDPGSHSDSRSDPGSQPDSRSGPDADSGPASSDPRPAEEPAAADARTDSAGDVPERGQTPDPREQSPPADGREPDRQPSGTDPDGPATPATESGSPDADRDRSGADPPGQSGADDRGAPAEDRTDRDDRLRRRIQRQEATIDRLQDRLSALEADREDRRARSDRLADRIEEVAGDLAELRRTVMRLDRTVERLEADADRGEPAGVGRSERPSAEESAADPAPGDGTAAPADATDRPAEDGRELSVEEALRETTVLVRYGSQGKSTLRTAHGGGADAPEVNDNLRLTAHTSFDDSTATVEGRPYAEFLQDRLEYRFFEWLLRELLYEIRDTGNQDALGDLYDAIPRIDRAEFSGSVELGEGSDGETAQFDLVARDDRDAPLVVMNFQESRDPATEGMVVELQDRGKAVCEAAGLSAAFLVTTSFFDGAAKDAAEAATSGRILSRSSKESFVRLSRKRGFHLCLAAVSEGDFHLRTPSL